MTNGNNAYLPAREAIAHIMPLESVEDVREAAETLANAVLADEVDQPEGERLIELLEMVSRLHVNLERLACVRAARSHADNGDQRCAELLADVARLTGGAA